MTPCPRSACGGQLWTLPNEQNVADKRPFVTTCSLCAYEGPTRAPTAQDHDRYRARPSTIDAAKLAGRLEERHRKVVAS